MNTTEKHACTCCVSQGHSKLLISAAIQHAMLARVFADIALTTSCANCSHRFVPETVVMKQHSLKLLDVCKLKTCFLFAQGIPTPSQHKLFVESVEVLGRS